MNLRKLFGLFVILNTCAISAENIVYHEDVYMQQARPELVSLVDEVAQEVGFVGNYELVEAKKSALLINPWNRVIGSGLNPQTKNNFIVINQDWFKNLPKDEQSFLIGRILLKFEKGLKPFSLKIIPFLFIPVFWLLIALFVWLINQTRFASKNKWLKLVAAYLMAYAFQAGFVLKFQQVVLNYEAIKYEDRINKLTLNKLPNKEAAVHALESMHATIQEGIKNGETAYLANAETFDNLAKKLSK